MAKIIRIDEHFQHFLGEMKESFWGDLYGQTRQAWQRFFELESERQRDRFSGWAPYERRRGKRRNYRNGYYERDFVTRFGTIRLRIARTREKSFLPVGLRRFQRRAEEVSLLIREAFLRGISTRQVGRVVATITGETVSAQTVSKLTRDDRLVGFQQRPPFLPGAAIQLAESSIVEGQMTQAELRSVSGERLLGLSSATARCRPTELNRPFPSAEIILGLLT